MRTCAVTIALHSKLFVRSVGSAGALRLSPLFLSAQCVVELKSRITEPFCFLSLAASFAPPKKATPLKSGKSSLFLQNTPGRGYPSTTFEPLLLTYLAIPCADLCGL